jgi:EAL domain-containing protein (putative c-di-GMP-specific phosphodiesterase class I)
MERVDTVVVTESELQRALDCGEVVRWYQPIVDLATGTPVQVEALLRWEHPQRGLLEPGEFLVGEDDHALLVRISWSVVIEAVRRAGDWRRAYPDRPIGVAVNLFDSHLDRRDLVGRVEQLLDAGEIPGPGILAFEVGEHHLDPTRSRLRERFSILRNIGVEVVVDDFGAAAAATTLSADVLRDEAVARLALLAPFPLDGLKLHPRFVARLRAGDDRDDERVRAVVDAARALDVPVVALGVEDDDMVEAARRTGFDRGQGFALGRPAPPAYVDELLAPR